MIMTDVVTFVFNCLNVGIFCGVAYYIFTTNAKPQILKKLHEKEEEKKQQHVQIQKLELDITQTQQLNYDKAEQERDLLNKVHRWQKSVVAFDKTIDIEREHCKKLVHQRIEHKQQELERHYSIVQVLPQVVATLKHDAKKHFAQVENMRQYDAAIIEFLEKSI